MYCERDGNLQLSWFLYTNMKIFQMISRFIFNISEEYQTLETLQGIKEKYGETAQKRSQEKKQKSKKAFYYNFHCTNNHMLTTIRIERVNSRVVRPPRAQAS